MANDDQKIKEECAKIAKINLDDSYIGALAASYHGIPEIYGKILSNLYDQTVDNAPNSHAWKTLFSDELKSEEGTIGRAILKKKAAMVVQESVEGSKVGDVLSLMGVKKDLSDDYKGKYFTELSEEERVQVMNGYLTSMTNQYAIKSLEVQRAAIAGGLEGIFCKDDAPKPKPSTPAPQAPKTAPKSTSTKRSAKKKKK